MSTMEPDVVEACRKEWEQRKGFGDPVDMTAKSHFQKPNLADQRAVVKKLRGEAWKLFWREFGAYRVLRALRLLRAILITSPLVVRVVRTCPGIFGRFVGAAMSSDIRWASSPSSEGTSRSGRSSR